MHSGLFLRAGGEVVDRGPPAGRRGTWRAVSTLCLDGPPAHPQQPPSCRHGARITAHPISDSGPGQRHMTASRVVGMLGHDRRHREQCRRRQRHPGRLTRGRETRLRRPGPQRRQPSLSAGPPRRPRAHITRAHHPAAPPRRALRSADTGQNITICVHTETHRTRGAGAWFIVRRVVQDTSLSRGNGCGPGTELAAQFKPWTRPPHGGLRHVGLRSHRYGLIHICSVVQNTEATELGVSHRQRQHSLVALPEIPNKIGAANCLTQKVGD